MTCLQRIARVSSRWGFVTDASEGHPAREHHHFACEQQTCAGVLPAGPMMLVMLRLFCHFSGAQYPVTPVTLAKRSRQLRNGLLNHVKWGLANNRCTETARKLGRRSGVEPSLFTDSCHLCSLDLSMFRPVVADFAFSSANPRIIASTCWP